MLIAAVVASLIWNQNTKIGDHDLKEIPDKAMTI